MSNQKGIAMLFIIMMASFVAVICIAGYFLISQHLDQVSQLLNQQSTNQDAKSQANQMASWNVLVNNEMGFSLKYPNNFFDSGSEPKVSVENCTTVSALDNCRQIPDIIAQNTIGGAANIKMDWQNFNGTKLVINNNPYILCQNSGASMGHLFNDYYYLAVKNNKCLLIDFIASQTICENYLPIEAGNTQQIASYNECVAKNKNQPNTLNQIINTFNFAQ